MKIENDIENLFKSQDFDVALPKDGHQLRFLRKLQKANKPVKRGFNKYYAIAAALVLFIGLSQMDKLDDVQVPVVVETTAVNLSEEVSNAQFYFEGIVKREIAKIELERNTDTQEIIENAFEQLKVLEKEQQNLQEQLSINYDKRVVKALIKNFQYRIQLLEGVMMQIELVKEIKTQNHEII